MTKRKPTTKRAKPAKAEPVKFVRYKAKPKAEKAPDFQRTIDANRFGPIPPTEALELPPARVGPFMRAINAIHRAFKKLRRAA